MNRDKTRLKAQVLIIGGGVTGTGLARDLSLRGLKCVVVEKGHVNAGASGANHGLLHSGARYVSNDPLTAQECRSESQLLKKLAPACCEETGGLFVAIEGDDEKFIADFPEHCRKNGLPVETLDCRDAGELEPELTDRIIAAYRVEDASVDPFRLAFENMSDAANRGAVLLTHSKVVALEKRGNRIETVRILQLRTGKEIEVEADYILNATGAWVGKITELAGISLPVIWSKGSLLVTHRRINTRVVNRLHPPGDGDIIVPGGTVSLAGTTSIRVDDIEHLRTGFEEADFLVEEAAKLIPAMRETRIMRAFAGVRPLLGKTGTKDDRSLSRGSQVVDHEEHGISNFISVVSGKLTTYRLVSEMAADLVCSKLGIDAPCLTRELPLPCSPGNDWVVAGCAPGYWMREKNPNDSLLCECEMVPTSAIAQIVDQFRSESRTVDLDSICRHTRMGKGSCQGAFCSLRTTAYLYELGAFKGDEGIQDLKDFLEARWKGLRPILWGSQLAQEQLQEAIHCGLLNLEG